MEWYIGLHENQCEQSKHEIDGAGWQGSGRREKQEEREGGTEEESEADEFPEVHQSGLLSGRDNGEVSWCGNENVRQRVVDDKG